MKINTAKLVGCIVVMLFLTATVIIFGSVSSHGQDRRNFWLLNNTGKKISSFYVSPHESESWGKDILGQAELPNGIGTIITFDSDVQTSCVMDFKIVFGDGSKQTYTTGRNVCTLGAVQFNRETSTPLFLPEQ